MQAMTKEHLLGQYQTKLNHIKLTYASSVIWSYPDSPRMFIELHQEVLRHADKRVAGLFPEICNFVSDGAALKIATEELYASAHRAALKELFPLTKKYCHSTGQLQLMKDKP